jgi:hypothetical protein
MHYMAARIRSEAADFIYKNYLADALYYYAQGKAVGIRYYDMLEDAKNNVNAKKDTRTGEEVFAEVVEKAGLEVRS